MLSAAPPFTCGEGVAKPGVEDPVDNTNDRKSEVSTPDYPSGPKTPTATLCGFVRAAYDWRVAPGDDGMHCALRPVTIAAHDCLQGEVRRKDDCSKEK